MDEKDRQPHRYIDDEIPTGSENFASINDQRRPFSPGQIIDNRFRVICLLGRGGAGTVYHVEQFLLKQEFAMKVLNPIQVTEEAWRRFQKEAQAAALLDHPGFVKVHDFGLIEGTIPFFTMDLVSGESLADHIRRAGPMPVKEAVPIFLQLCFALNYAHSKGIVHRDLKPSNIGLFFSDTIPGAQIKILDFGIAKLIGADAVTMTKTGTVFGTPFYMSPEQCLGQAIDRRSDIYSLGCVFFEVLTGGPPFTTENALALMMQHQSERPPSLKEASMGLDFPKDLESIVAKMLAKDPNDRYQSLTDAADDLMSFQQGKKNALTFTSSTSKGAAKKSNTTLLIYIAVALTILIGLLVFIAAKPESSTSSLPVIHDEPAIVRSPFDDIVGSARYFSVIDPYGSKIPGTTKRTFHFPQAWALGDLKYYDLNDVQVGGPATKDVVCLTKGPGSVDLNVSYSMISTMPNLLRKFRPDEIGVLTFGRNALGINSDGEEVDNAMYFVRDYTGLWRLVLPVSATDRSVEIIGKLPRPLHILCVAGSKVTGGALAKTNKVRTFIQLNADSIRDARPLMRALKQNSVLQNLRMCDDGLQDEDLKSITGLKELKELAIRGNPGITDRGLEYLVNLPNLERLAVDGCTITPKSIDTFRRMKIKDALSINTKSWPQSARDELALAVHCKIVSYRAEKAKLDEESGANEDI